MKILGGILDGKKIKKNQNKIRCVFKMEKIPVKKKKLVKINKIEMGIEICIEVPNWLAQPIFLKMSSYAHL